MHEINVGGKTFTDRINPETKEVLQTAEEVYQEWLENKDKQIDICSTPTIEEQLLATQKMLLSLQEQIIDMA